jgi:hypothetical protein
MSEKIQTNQPVELQLLTPELGVFIVTGILQDVEPVMHDFRGRSVSQSTFERIAYGRAAKKLFLF